MSTWRHVSAQMRSFSCCTSNSDPDFLATPNAYMWLKPRHTWCDVFVKWLREPHHLDDLSDSEVDSTEGEVDDVEDDRSVASEDAEEEEEEDTDSEEEDSVAELEAK